MADARTPLIAGNWKMNGSAAFATELAQGVSAGASDVAAELLVCPPSVLIPTTASALSAGVALGGQDCHAAESGAHTGDNSAKMLKDAGCAYVIVGHSERRTDHGETDDQVRVKAEAAHRAGLRAVICIGETDAERDSGKTLDVISGQLAGSVPAASTAANTVIAYEPVWAIGTGRTPTNDDVQDVHAHIRAVVKASHGDAVAAGVRLLYGGSMKPENAVGLLALADVDGGLIGGASLKAADFLAIAASCP
jgi:triosephosphate isomerase (TIM)